MEGKSSIRDYFNACIREGPNSHCADCGASGAQLELLIDIKIEEIKKKSLTGGKKRTDLAL